jgi:hypothetical protein
MNIGSLLGFTGIVAKIHALAGFLNDTHSGCVQITVGRTPNRSTPPRNNQDQRESFVDRRGQYHAVRRLPNILYRPQGPKHEGVVLSSEVVKVDHWTVLLRRQRSQVCRLRIYGSTLQML